MRSEYSSTAAQERQTGTKAGDALALALKRGTRLFVVVRIVYPVVVVVHAAVAAAASVSSLQRFVRVTRAAINHSDCDI